MSHVGIEALKLRAKASGWSALGREVGVSRMALSRWVAGNAQPTPERVARLLELGIPWPVAAPSPTQPEPANPVSPAEPLDVRSTLTQEIAELRAVARTTKDPRARAALSRAIAAHTANLAKLPPPPEPPPPPAPVHRVELVLDEVDSGLVDALFRALDPYPDAQRVASEVWDAFVQEHYSGPCAECEGVAGA